MFHFCNRRLSQELLDGIAAARGIPRLDVYRASSSGSIQFGSDLFANADDAKGELKGDHESIPLFCFPVESNGESSSRRQRRGNKRANKRAM